MQQFGHHNISINDYGTQVAQTFHLREQQGDNYLTQKDGPEQHAICHSDEAWLSLLYASHLSKYQIKRIYQR